MFVSIYCLLTYSNSLSFSLSYIREVVNLLMKAIWIFGGTRRQDVLDIGGCRRQDEGRVAVTSLSCQRRRDTTRSCGCAVAVVSAEGDDASLRWWVRDVSSFQSRGTLTPGSSKPWGTSISYDRFGVLSPVPLQHSISRVSHPVSFILTLATNLLVYLCEGNTLFSKFHFSVKWIAYRKNVHGHINSRYSSRRERVR